MSECQRRGLRCEDGQLWAAWDGAVIQTPEEKDFIEACGLAWEDPWNRH